MKFTPMKYEPVVATVSNHELWFSYVVYPKSRLSVVMDNAAQNKMFVNLPGLTVKT